MRPQIAPRDAPNTVGESPGVREVPLVGLTAAVSFLRSARAAARMGVRPGIRRSALLWTRPSRYGHDEPQEGSGSMAGMGNGMLPHGPNQHTESDALEGSRCAVDTQ